MALGQDVLLPAPVGGTNHEELCRQDTERGLHNSAVPASAVPLAPPPKPLTSAARVTSQASSTTRRTRCQVQLQQDNSPRSTPRASRIRAVPTTRRARRRRGTNFFLYQPLLGAGASPNTRRARRSWRLRKPPVVNYADRWPRDIPPKPTLIGRWRLHGQPASRQGHGGKGRWNLPSKFPPFFAKPKTFLL